MATRPRGTTTTTTTRLMLPDDANPAGNVHGGTILQLIEQAGFIAASRHCRVSAAAESSVEPRWCVLATVSECTFERPMHIGDVSRCDARVTYAAGAAVEVLVQVFREDLISGESHRTNKSRLWYVQCKLGDGPRVGSHHKFVAAGPVPDLDELTEEERAAGATRYVDHRRSMRVDDPAETAVGPHDDWTFEQLKLSQLMLPSDATETGVVFGGTLMKMMDSAAGITAYRHCKRNVVTVSISDLHLVSPVTVGSVVTVHSRITFTSSRSMEIQIECRSCGHTGEVTRCAAGIFNFVCLDDSGKPVPLPQFTPSTPAEEARAKAGAARYEAAREKRMAAMAKASKSS